MAGKKDRVYLNDSKAIVREKLDLEDNEDFSKFEVGLLLYPVLFYRNELRFPIRIFVLMPIDSSFL